MASEKRTKKPTWGGSRKGAGRPEGRTKTKICISVNEAVWHSALAIWRGKKSPLVEKLLSAYVYNAGANNHAEAV